MTLKSTPKQLAYAKEWYRKNRDKRLAQTKLWQSKNRAKKYEHKRRAEKKAYSNSVEFRLKTIARSRMRSALVHQSSKKSLHSIELIGCSPTELRTHIESLWKEGMSWGNYGRHGWHIDHIKPCSAFDLTNPEEQRKCFHFTNLQPLWAEDNIKKSDTYLEYNG